MHTRTAVGSAGGDQADNAAAASEADLYTVVCASPTVDLEAIVPATYPVHVVASSPKAAMAQVESLGHLPRAAFCRGTKGRPVPATRMERLLGWRRADVCVNCGYLLDGLIVKDGTVSCPECGSRIRLWARRAVSIFGKQ